MKRKTYYFIRYTDDERQLHKCVYDNEKEYLEYVKKRIDMRNKK